MGNYIKIKIKERKWYLIVLSIFWLYVIGVLQCFNVTNTEYKKSNNVSNLDVHWEQLLAGTVVEQELDIEDSGLRKIGITFGTSGRENNCSLRITFCEKEKNVVLYDEIISGRNLVNLDEYVLSFEDANVEKGTYLLSIKGIDGTEDNVVALLCTNN